MIIGQLMESSWGLVCARRGSTTDATFHMPVDHDELRRALVECGYRANGRRTLFDGVTGEYMDTSVFVTPVYMQRLQKFVLDEEQVVGTRCSTDPVTGQPLAGKRSHGGLRLGEMECWASMTHGSMNNLWTKIYQHSDHRVQHLCRSCGKPAVFNAQHGIYSCKLCGDMANITSVDSSKSAMLMQYELEASNISVRFGLTPPTFAVRGPS
jgi:DNA-directed RNA polymerase I subunit RPA2